MGPAHCGPTAACRPPLPGVATIAGPALAGALVLFDVDVAYTLALGLPVVDAIGGSVVR